MFEMHPDIFVIKYLCFVIVEEGALGIKIVTLELLLLSLQLHFSFFSFICKLSWGSVRVYSTLYFNTMVK